MNASAQTGHESDQVTLEIVELVAARTEEPPESLPPIYDRVDPDVFELLCGSDRYGSDLEIRFSYYNHEVVVNGDGNVSVTELT